jgi:hypothetical protein
MRTTRARILPEFACITDMLEVKFLSLFKEVSLNTSLNRVNSR